MYSVVETEVDGVSKSTNERAPPLVGSLGLSSSVQNIIFYIYGQAAMLDRLSLNMSLSSPNSSVLAR